MFEYPDFLKHFLPEERFLATYLRSATGDVHAAEDLLQNVACVLWKKFGDYDPSRPFGAWAVGVAKLEVLKWRQETARSREVLSEETMRLLAETAAQQRETLESRDEFLTDCLEKLAGSARNVLHWKYGQGCPIREIAQRLRKTVPAVEMILVRSRRTLRECIQRKLSQSERGRP